MEIENQINNMDWNPNEFNKTKDNMIKSAQEHAQTIDKKNTAIIANKHYQKNKEEIDNLAKDSLHEVILYMTILSITKDKTLTHEEQKALVIKIIPTEEEFNRISMQSKVILEDVIMPSLVEYWTAGHRIMGELNE